MTMRNEAGTLTFLVAIDGSANSDAAVRWVARLRASGIALRGVLLHARQPVMSGEVGVASPADLVIAARERNATEILGRAARVLQSAGLEFVIDDRMDDPLTAVVACAGAHHCDAIALGRRGRGALSAALVGSVATETIRQALVPVIVINVNVPEPLTPLRVLLAADGSAGATHAAAFTARLAGAGIGGEVHLLHVQPGLTVGGAVFGSRASLLKHWSAAGPENAFTAARGILERAGCSCITHLVSDDNPGDAILRAADRLGCGLIAMGTRGLGPVAGLLLGSVARHVVQHARVPVVLTRC